MTFQDPTRRERRRARGDAGAIGGYAGFILSLVTLLNAATEGSAPPADEAATMVLVLMMLGYAAGWLLQPFISQLFPQS